MLLLLIFVIGLTKYFIGGAPLFFPSFEFHTVKFTLSNPNVISKLAEYIGIFKLAEELIDNLREKKAFLKAVLDVVIKADNVHHVITPEIIINYFDVIKDVLPDTYQDVVKRSAEGANLAEILTEYEFHGDLSDLYLLCLDITTEKTQESFVKYLAAEMCALDLQKWLSEVKNTDFVNLTKRIINLGQNECVNYIHKNL